MCSLYTLRNFAKNNRYHSAIVSNYWTRLSKISWFVSCEQINYLPKPKAEISDMRDTDKSRCFAITEFNNCFIIRSPSLFFKEYLWEARRCRHFHTRVITRRRKVWFHLRMSMRIVFPAKNSWTTLRISTPLFVGSYLQVTWWALGQWKGRNISIEW